MSRTLWLITHRERPTSSSIATAWRHVCATIRAITLTYVSRRLMTYKATGRLHKIFATEQKSSSFSVRDFVIEVPDDKFPQMVKFQLTQDKCALIDDYSEGDEICVDFDLRGREWNDKYFTNLNAWRIDLANSQDSATQEMPNAGNAPELANNNFDDDIPF